MTDSLLSVVWVFLLVIGLVGLLGGLGMLYFASSGRSTWLADVDHRGGDPAETG